MLFHWLDDSDILEPEKPNISPTIVRIVNPDNTKTEIIDRDTAFMIGRASITEDELACLKKRGLLGILEIDEAQRLMKLPVHSESCQEETNSRDRSFWTSPSVLSDERDRRSSFRIGRHLHPLSFPKCKPRFKSKKVSLGTPENSIQWQKIKQWQPPPLNSTFPSVQFATSRSQELSSSANVLDVRK